MPIPCTTEATGFSRAAPACRPRLARSAAPVDLPRALASCMQPRACKHYLLRGVTLGALHPLLPPWRKRVPLQNTTAHIYIYILYGYMYESTMGMHQIVCWVGNFPWMTRFVQNTDAFATTKAETSLTHIASPTCQHLATFARFLSRLFRNKCLHH